MQEEREPGRLTPPEIQGTPETERKSYAQLLVEAWANLNELFDAGDLRAFIRARDQYAGEFVNWWAKKLQEYQQAFGVINFEDWKNVQGPAYVLQVGSDQFSRPRFISGDPHQITFHRISPEGKDDINFWFGVSNKNVRYTHINIESGVGVPPKDLSPFTAISPDFPLVFSVRTEQDRLRIFQRSTRLGDERSGFYATKTELLDTRIENAMHRVSSPQLPF